MVLNNLTSFVMGVVLESANNVSNRLNEVDDGFIKDCITSTTRLRF